MLVTTAAPNDQNIAIFLSDKMLTDDKRPSPNLTFNPESQQSSGWSDDRVASLPGRGTAIWVAGSVMADGAYKVYLKNTSVWFSRQATSLSTTLYAELPDGTKMASLPEVTLTRDRSWVLFGTITINGNYRPVFKVETFRYANTDPHSEAEPHAAAFANSSAETARPRSRRSAAEIYGSPAPHA